MRVLAKQSVGIERGGGGALLPLRFNSRGEVTLMTLRRARLGSETAPQPG